MPTRLSLETLDDLPGTIARPAYCRDALTPGIVHFGVGNFHRAHQAVYLDDLFCLGEGHDWAIIGAGVRPADEHTRQILAGQDFLSMIVEQETLTTTARVTAPMVDFIAPEDRGRLIQTLARPEIRIVSLTITEGGYYLDSKGAFNSAHPDIVADAIHPDDPHTVFGLILAGLVRRRALGLEPFTVMSCDNIPHNGRVTQNAVAGLARLADPALADWIVDAVAFPNGMVDRITPATSDRERSLAASEFGVADGWPVFCETFRQWVLEDNFPAGRPALEKVGVTFVADVSPYELMKIRILNGGHAAIAYPAALLDIHFVHEAMANPLIVDFLAKLTAEEIIPVVPPVPNVNLADYAALTASRFANPRIGDTIQRLCLDGSNRQPKFILPSVIDRLAIGHSVTGLALVSALWCRYCYGVTDSGASIAPNDPAWDRLQATAIKAKAEPSAWLAVREIFGSLADNTAYVASFTHALETLWQIGTHQTLKRYIDGNL